MEDYVIQLHFDRSPRVIPCNVVAKLWVGDEIVFHLCFISCLVEPHGFALHT